MSSETINIRVDADTAKSFRSMSDEDRRKLETLLCIRFSEVTRSDESLDAVINEIREQALERGLTAETLRSLLSDT